MEELSIRHWMVIIGGLMIAAVLVDSLRRFWGERRAEIRLNARIDRSKSGDAEDPFNLLTELPNGGARIIRRDDLFDPADEPEHGPAFPPMDAPAQTNGADTEFDNLDPIDRALQEEAAFDSDAELPGSSPHLAGSDGSGPPSTSMQRRRTVKSAFKEPSILAGEAAAAAEGSQTVDWLETLEPDQVDEADEVEHGRLPRGANTHVFILYVVATTEEGFSGTDILETLLACDLRFGDMDFFHRHERASGRGPIEFSVANMMKPGVFDIDNMEPLQTRGLMFFVTLPGPTDMLKAFDYMYETAKVVVKRLGGDIQDETRSVITRQSLEHMRQQIRELERRLLVRRS
jgi:cell division protein ZipA